MIIFWSSIAEAPEKILLMSTLIQNQAIISSSSVFKNYSLMNDGPIERANGIIKINRKNTVRLPISKVMIVEAL